MQLYFGPLLDNHVCHDIYGNWVNKQKMVETGAWKNLRMVEDENMGKTGR